MRTSSIALAVAGIVAASSANAAVDLYISGASAQRSFYLADFTAACAAAPTVYTVGGITDNPDNQAWRCNAVAAAGIPGVADGEQMTVHYSAELGSVYGISLALPGRPSTRLFVNPDSADCSGTVCTIASYDNNTETFTSTNNTALVSHTADMLVTDLKPTMWGSSANWPTYANLNPGGVYTVPSAAELTTLANNFVVVNGQVFSAIANNASPIAALGNISRASLQGIATGKYDVWGDVPEVGGGNNTPIFLCRRDQGSGTQVAASVFLTGVECGKGTVGFATQAVPGSLGANILENGTTAKVRTCVQNNTGGIGFTSVGTSASYKTLLVDGVQANAHNGAAGIYPWSFDDFVYDRSASSGAGAGAIGLAGRLLTNAKRSDKIASIETGGIKPTNDANGIAGTWFVAAPKTVYVLPIGGTGNTPKSLAKWATTTAGSVALTLKNGDNCKISINDNTN